MDIEEFLIRYEAGESDFAGIDLSGAITIMPDGTIKNDHCAT